MIKRICPVCFTRWYSSNTLDEDWICESCGSIIPKSTETNDLEEKDIKENN
jgi:PHP family Zn ribbon phosphoesterase